MNKTLDKDYHKIQAGGVNTRKDGQLSDPPRLWQSGQRYIWKSLQVLINAVQEKFSLQAESDCHHLYDATTTRDMQAFLAHLMSAFDVYSGLTPW